MSIHYISKENLKKFRGKTCLLRVDLNIEPGLPAQAGQEKKSFRIEAILPTIKLLLKNGVKVIILSHRGRPRGYDKSLSLRPFAAILQKKLRQKVAFMAALSRGVVPKNGNVFLVENLRFWRGEEKNDLKFAKKLARLGDFYVNDAFAVSHRKNASVVAITKFLPAYGGLLLEREIENLGGILKYTTRPFVIILGGAKISDKLGVMKYFWNKADNFLLGGGPANTFLAAQKLPVGDSLYDKESVFQVRRFLNSKKLILPIDLKIVERKILDIGERTISRYSAIIDKSRAVIWNGPMGFFEKKGFEKGTVGIWRAILRNKKAKIIVGGGETTDSLQLLKKARVPANVFLSTGGGAMLEYLSGKKLPGIESLKK